MIDRTRSDSPPVRRLHAAAFLSIFCVGVYATSFGPALPFLADDFGVSLDTAGLLLTALFIGSISASGALIAALQRTEARPLAALGLLCAGLGLLAIGVAGQWPPALAGAAVLGLGDGLIVAASHGMVATTAADVPHTINRLNLWFAVGAVLGPLWAGGVLSLTEEPAIIYAGIAALTFASVAIMLMTPRVPMQHAQATDGRRSYGPQVWLMGGVLLLYVGAEVGLGAWVNSYAKESAGAGVMAGALVSSGYWGALGLGRLGTDVLFARGQTTGMLLTASLIGGGLASLALALAGDHIVVAGAAAFATGLCFGPIWPVAMAIGTRGAPTSATAVMVTMGNAGGVVLPWLQGVILVSAGPREGVLLTAGLCGAMLLIALAAGARHPAAAPVSP